MGREERECKSNQANQITLCVLCHASLGWSVLNSDLLQDLSTAAWEYVGFGS